VKFRRLDKRIFFLLGIIVVYSTIVGLKNPYFLSIQTVFDTIRSSSEAALVALGLLVIMIAGNIDISFPAIALFGGYVTVVIMIATGIDNLFFAFALSTLFGVVLGLFNGFLVHSLKIPALIITLGTQYLFHGIMTTFIGSATYGAGVMPKSILSFSAKQLFQIKLQYGTTGLTYFVIPVVIAIAVTWFILYRTMLGRGIFAMGNSEEAARRVGFNPLVIRLFVYGYMGALAGMMGIIHLASVNAVYPNALIGTEMMVIAAVVLGGASFSGGRGTILGALLGVIIINLMNNTLIFLGLSSSWNNFCVGALMVISVVITSYQERLENRRKLLFTD
jgi:simple sugar transport system permease protein